MIELEEYKRYLKEIGLAQNSISFYSSHITTGLQILDQIDEFNRLNDIEKLKEFSEKDTQYKKIYDNYHSGNDDTFSDNRSVAGSYIRFLQYKKIIETLNMYENNPNAFQLNGATWFFSIFTQDKKYPIKAICKYIESDLELNNDFTTNQAKTKLRQIFKENNIQFIDINDIEENIDSLKKKEKRINIKNIILYGAPGVGKTHNYQNLISMIENDTSQKEIFDTISNNLHIELNNDTFQKIKDEKRVEFITFHQSYSYEDFIEGFRPNENGNIKLEDGIFKKLCEEANENKEKNYYIVIDEINRGNISKIFGELITLIEEDKRDVYDVTLPYSKEKFRVPSNLYIIATMNSTDKSIATIDIALRRRFTFLKMKPNLDLVKNDNAREMMEKLNEYIIKSNLGEDYQLGHSYFMKVQNDDDLEFVKEYKIKPLLEEYFYADDKTPDDIIEEVLKIKNNND